MAESNIYNFSNENLISLSHIISNLCDTLTKTGHVGWVDYLSKIEVTAQQHNHEAFNSYVVSNEIFGGAGAMWEIWIEAIDLRIQFEKQFCEFVDLLKNIGVSNVRIDQIREGFKFIASKYTKH